MSVEGQSIRLWWDFVAQIFIQGLEQDPKGSRFDVVGPQKRTMRCPRRMYDLESPLLATAIPVKRNTHGCLPPENKSARSN